MRKEDELNQRIEQLLIENAKLKDELHSSRFELGLFDLLLEHFPDNIYFKDTMASFIKVSKGMANMFKSTQAEMKGKNDFDYFPEELAKSKFDDDMEVIKSKVEIRNKVEEDRHQPDGEESWVSSTKVPMYNSKSELIGLMGISRDVTNEKKAEDALKEALKEKSRLLQLLRQTSISRDFFENIMNSLSEGLFVINLSGKIQNANRAACKMSGYSFKELQNKKISQFIHVEGADKKRWFKEDFSSEVLLTGKIEKPIPCIFSLSALKNENHQETTRICVFKDITKIKEAENKLKKLNESLEEKVLTRTSQLEEANRELRLSQQEIQVQNDELVAQNEKILYQWDQIEHQNRNLKVAQSKLDDANLQLTHLNQDLEVRVKERTAELLKSNDELDKFVYSASHDLSAPLKSILGLINLTKNEVDENFKQECLNRMEGSILKLEDVISSLIQYSRNSRGEVELESIKLKKLILDIYEQLQYSENGDNCTFSIDISDDLEIVTDKQRFKTIISNILSNAIKYKDHTKGNNTIEVGFQESDGHYMISVRDNGIGIHKEAMKEIFNMFYRATSMSFGSGLGLYIAKETLHKLGGNIIVKSKEGEGSTFILKFSK